MVRKKRGSEEEGLYANIAITTQPVVATHSRKFGCDRDEDNRHTAEEKLHLLHLRVSDTCLTTQLRGEEKM